MRNRFDSSSACSSACRMLPLCWKMKSATDATMPRRSGQLIKTMAEFFIARPHILSRLPASVRHETKCVRLNIANSTRKHRPHTCEPLSSGLKETKEPRPSIGWTEWSPCRGCLWRIVISPTIPQDSPSCYDSVMRNLVVLFIHFLATLVRLLGPGGVRSIVAESLLLKHQLLIVNRSRQRSPNLFAWDRILAGWMALLVCPTRLLRSAIVLKPSTLLALHKALSTRKYRILFSP